MPFTVPGIGYAGLGQQTAAAQLVFRKAGSGSSTSGRPRKKRAKRPKTYTRARRIPGKGRKRNTRGASLVKGSAAAKRRMAQLRKMRRK